MAGSVPIYSAQDEQRIMTELWSRELADDPRDFVRFVYPWGQPNTPLATQPGPRAWQDEVMKDIADYIAASRRSLDVDKILPSMYKAAVASGRGIGKSALFSWIAHWLVSTRLGGSVWVAANGENQLKSKTFPEISKWVSMGINSHWFDINATSIVPAKWLTEVCQRDRKIDPKYWYISAQLWSEENPDAFAGAHNGYGEMYLFDEASGIPKPIWTVAQGVFTEEIIDRYWLAFSNPRRNDGAFFECFHGPKRNSWHRWQIDGRQVERIAADAYNDIIEEFGENSDQARMEIYGQFPNQAEKQFVPIAAVQEAKTRVVYPDPGAPLLMGCDVARGGDDKCVIAYRKGRDARTIPWKVYPGMAVDKFAEIIAESATALKVDAIFVDGGGVGGGAVDMLKRWGFKVIEVQFGSSPNDGNAFANKRTEMWSLMREWLQIGAIPASDDLQTDLIGPQYDYNPVNNKLILETKQHMKEKRGLASPDEADALAMTFAQTIARTDSRASAANSRRHSIARDVDYTMLS